jgi:GntR family transcriptional regulator / MocR family aminotransferase
MPTPSSSRPPTSTPWASVLSPERRGALVDWARRRGGWIIEDDYDAEFRYDRDPVGTVQGLAPQRTIHLGSVAKTLAPSVRVGWIVVPEELLAPLVATHETRVSQPATLEQLVLARLIEEGRYDRHLRGVRRRYRERRDALLDGLAGAGLDERVEGIAAGMQAVLRLDDGTDDAASSSSSAIGTSRSCRSAATRSLTRPRPGHRLRPADTCRAPDGSGDHRDVVRA